MWYLWWTKSHYGRFPPSTSGSPANSHSTTFSILICHPGLYNRPINGRHTKWTQSHLTLTKLNSVALARKRTIPLVGEVSPHPTKLKRKFWDFSHDLPNIVSFYKQKFYVTWPLVIFLIYKWGQKKLRTAALDTKWPIFLKFGVNAKITVLWDVTPCSVIDFGELAAPVFKIKHSVSETLIAPCQWRIFAISGDLAMKCCRQASVSLAMSLSIRLSAGNKSLHEVTWNLILKIFYWNLPTHDNYG
jgi:hypothetical protein